MLVDRDDYWLNAEYRQWVTDPDDPEVKRAREERKRRKVKPPPSPILPPVALRPEGMASIRRSEYERAAAAAAPPPDPQPEQQPMTVREFAQMFGA